MQIAIQQQTVYQTWYDFKKELQKRSEKVLLNALWLQIKPRAPLPWTESHMVESLDRLLYITSSVRF